MAELIADTLDFAQYMRSTDPAVKVRRASAFLDDLIAEFRPSDGASKPHMFSTKLRDMIEFRPGEITCWAGYNGHRKSMFTGQVALDLCAQNERTLLASFEMQPSRSLARMARQAFGKAYPVGDELRAFGKWSDGRLWIFDHLGRITPDACIAVCRYFAAELRGQHVFIDSMMMVCASEESLDEQKQFVTDLVRLAQETGLHIHLVTHCRKPQSGGDERMPSKYDLRGSAAISDQAHNVVMVWANKAKQAKLDKDPNDMEALSQPDAVVEIAKQRNGEFEGKAALWFHRPSMRFADDRSSRIEPYACIGGAA